MLIFDQLKKNDPQIRLLTIAVLAGLSILLSGLWYVQIISAHRYRESEKAQSFRTVRIPAQRGWILDRNGMVLAENRPSFNLHLYLKDVRTAFHSNYLHLKRQKEKEGKTRWSAAERDQLGKLSRYMVASNFLSVLTPVLGRDVTVDWARFNSHFAMQTALPLPVLNDLNPDQVARFLENPKPPPGLQLEIQSLRHYPHGTLAAHLIGHLTRDESYDSENEITYSFRLSDFRGAMGLERRYDQVLRGQPGMKSVLVNNLGYSQSETTFPLPQQGDTLVLTLDLGIQQAAEKALRALGPETRGAAIVMDARSGDLYAMVSSPAFDPNIYVPAPTPEQMQYLNDEKLKPGLNRCTYAIYAPGSIFKIVTSLAALEAGVMDPDALLYSPGFTMVGRRRIGDEAGAGEYNFIRAFKKSSNVYFIEHALRKGVKERMAALGRKLQLGQRLGAFPGQELGGDFPALEEMQRGWSDGDTANLSIGQGRIAVTPMHMAVMTAAIANGGKVLQPRIVLRTEPADPRSQAQGTTFPGGRVRDTLDVQPRHLQLVRKAMLADVEEEEGTGRRAYVPGMGVCGKTGTAEVKIGNRQVGKNTWFVSFAPYDDPRYVVVVMVEDGHFGGTTCAPVARAIYEAIQAREKGAQGRQSLVRHP
jgi:penicillin-binding protein 2